MRAASKVLSTVVAALGLVVFLPASSSAGSFTIHDVANDIISISDDNSTGRLTTTNCPGSETLSCIFVIAGPTGAVMGGTAISATSVNLLEGPGFTLASDTLHNNDFGSGGSNVWSFVSSETSIALLSGGTFGTANFNENGTAQTVETITYHSVTGSIVGTDTILIQSDLDTVVPEPASASLLVLGGGLLLAAGRLRRRVRG